MTTTILISFRETLEASLIIGVVLAFLSREGDKHSMLWAIFGIAGGICVSFVAAYILEMTSMVFTESMEQVFEGALMLVAAAMLVWIIAWMGGHGKYARSAVESDVREHVQNGTMIGIFLLCFIATAREGMEMAVFLRATLVGFTHSITTSLGIIVGVGLAISCSLALFRGLRGIPLKKFFSLSSVLLLCIGCGLVIRGIGELQESSVLRNLSSILWDSSWLLDEHSFFGHIATTFIGYEEQPTQLQGIMGSAYLILVSLLLARTQRHAPLRRGM